MAVVTLVVGFVLGFIAGAVWWDGFIDGGDE